MTGYVSRVRSLLAGITPGEWRHERAVMSDIVETSNRVHIASIHSQHDAAFIAEAPAAVTHLLARLDAVEAVVAEFDAKPGHRWAASRLRAVLAGDDA